MIVDCNTLQDNTVVNTYLAKLWLLIGCDERIMCIKIHLFVQ